MARARGDKQLLMCKPVSPRASEVRAYGDKQLVCMPVLRNQARVWARRPAHVAPVVTRRVGRSAGRLGREPEWGCARGGWAGQTNGGILTKVTGRTDGPPTGRTDRASAGGRGAARAGRGAARGRTARGGPFAKCAAKGFS